MERLGGFASGASGHLVARVVSVSALSAELREAMWRLFERYYADVTCERFQHDLSEKQEVILLFDSGDRSMRGFSTLLCYEDHHRGRRFVAVYSGDTVIDEAYWGQRALQRRFVRWVVLQKLRRPFTPVYWFLITKGYKTYLLLSRNFPNYWPRHDRPTPDWESSLIDHLARSRFGDAWKPELGVLRFDSSLGRLREGVASVDASIIAAPDARFFVEKNPGHAVGDELCCIGRVGLDLWGAFTLRLLRRALAGTKTRARRIWAAAMAVL